MIMKETNKKWISEYARLSNLYGCAIEAGNHKQANKVYDKLMEAYRQIKAQGALTSEDFHELLFVAIYGHKALGRNALSCNFQ